MICLIKNSTKVLNNLKLKSSLYTYDFLTLYTALPHNFIKKRVINFFETTFYREGTLYLACDDKIAFFSLDDQKIV